MAALPGYMFVPYDLWNTFYQWARERYSVAPLYRYGKDAAIGVEPARVAASEVDRVTDLLEETPTGANAPPPTFKPRDSVRIIAGPLAGYEGRVEGAHPRGVRVQLIMRWVTISPLLLIKL